VNYDKANPGKSTRQAAADLGVSKSEVDRARQKSPVPCGTPDDSSPDLVTGRDGKEYPARRSSDHGPLPRLFRLVSAAFCGRPGTQGVGGNVGSGA
jgi:hypothetical protein